MPLFWPLSAPLLVVEERPPLLPGPGAPPTCSSAIICWASSRASNSPCKQNRESAAYEGQRRRRCGCSMLAVAVAVAAVAAAGWVVTLPPG